MAVASMVVDDRKEPTREWLRDKDREKREQHANGSWLTQAELEELGIFATPLVARSSAIGQHSRIGFFSEIESDVTIGDEFLGSGGLFVGEGAKIGNNVFIQNHVVIGAGADIGDNVKIGQDVFIGPGVKIGAGTTIGHFVFIAGQYTPVVNDTGDPEFDDPEFYRTEAHNTVIGAGVEIKSWVGIGSGIYIGDEAVIGGYVEVRDNAIIDAHAKVAGHSVVEPATVSETPSGA